MVYHDIEVVYLYEEFVKNRITQLRIQKGVSEYQMGYDLGHSRGYVYKHFIRKVAASHVRVLCDMRIFRNYSRRIL